jgi:hypothetical protein
LAIDAFPYVVKSTLEKCELIETDRSANLDSFSVNMHELETLATFAGCCVTTGGCDGVDLTACKSVFLKKKAGAPSPVPADAFLHKF